MEVILVDRTGTPASKPASAANPGGAVALHFGVDDTITEHPEDQLQLKHDIEIVQRAIQRIYLGDNAVPTNDRFAEYLDALLGISHLGMTGVNALPKVGTHALKGLIEDLIDTEGPKLKDRRLRELARHALWLSVPFAIAYVLLRSLASCGWMTSLSHTLLIDPLTVASFCCLWIGCFVGVVLSYGIRKSVLTIEDFIRFDADRLLPLTRLVFAGAMTMLVGVMLVIGIVEIKVGTAATSDFATWPMLAFLIGALCGITELTLPALLADKTGKIFKTS